MSRQSKGAPRRSRRPATRRRRRLVRLVSVLVGGTLAATGGWLYAGAGRGQERETASAAPAPASIGLPLAPPEVADPSVRGGALQVPIVDWTEVLPSCH